MLGKRYNTIPFVTKKLAIDRKKLLISTYGDNIHNIKIFKDSNKLFYVSYQLTV